MLKRSQLFTCLSLHRYRLHWCLLRRAPFASVRISGESARKRLGMLSILSPETISDRLWTDKPLAPMKVSLRWKAENMDDVANTAINFLECYYLNRMGLNSMGFNHMSLNHMGLNL